MKYGDKRDYKKINIFVNGEYNSSTTWAKTCKEAKQKYIEKYGILPQCKIVAKYDKGGVQ